MFSRPLFVVGFLLLPMAVSAADADALIKEALAAEARLDPAGALSLFREADAARPNNAFILQKISRELSDLTADVPDTATKKRLAGEALVYAQRATDLDPKNPINVLSLAICHGKLGLYSDNRTRIEYSRRVKEEAERALALDPNYDWAYHVLGRWNYEVASLSGPTRLVVKLIYGGLPNASCEQAVADLKKAMELSPDTVAHQLELGFAYLACGKKAEARAQFEQGLARPSHEKYDEEEKAKARAALEKLK
jgi:tetratricopeptide (TPR) repeat protein